MRGRMVVVVAAALGLAGAGRAEEPYRVGWIRQLGTSGLDSGYGVAAGAAGSVAISGDTYGSLGGPSAGAVDAFVSKYDPAGGAAWTRQLGTFGQDYGRGAAADPAGNVFIGGYTTASLGGPNAGGKDAFVAKYDPAGSLLWKRQLGTAVIDQAEAVAADALGNVFISGQTYGDLDGTNAGLADAFVAKYDGEGTLLWTRQLGTADADVSIDVAADAAGNVFISGQTWGSLDGPNAGGPDAFVSKYDPDGTLLWTRQLGTADVDWSHGVAADASGNVFISGQTYGDLDGANAGGEDAFLAKYDGDGNPLWTRQLGTADNDSSLHVAADASGSAFISGYTHGSLGGPNAGGLDAFLSKYDPDGNLLWTRQLGTAEEDVSYGVAAAASGSVFIGGYTAGSLGGPNAGDYDAFVVRLLPPPLMPGDANLDGCVDGLDYNAWSYHYLGPAGWCEGDFNDDMAADGLDYNAWSLNYHAGCEGAALPEPAMTALLAAGFACVLWRRSRQA